MRCHGSLFGIFRASGRHIPRATRETIIRCRGLYIYCHIPGTAIVILFVFCRGFKSYEVLAMTEQETDDLYFHSACCLFLQLRRLCAHGTSSNNRSRHCTPYPPFPPREHRHASLMAPINLQPQGTESAEGRSHFPKQLKQKRDTRMLQAP